MELANFPKSEIKEFKNFSNEYGAVEEDWATDDHEAMIDRITM